MNRKEIEKKAQCWVDNYPQLDEGTYTQDDADMMMKYSFIAGAEWMQSELTARVYHALENILSKQVLDGLVKILKEE